MDECVVCCGCENGDVIGMELRVKVMEERSEGVALGFDSTGD